MMLRTPSPWKLGLQACTTTDFHVVLGTEVGVLCLLGKQATISTTVLRSQGKTITNIDFNIKKSISFTYSLTG